jgi:hypothetical protein
MEMRIRMGMGIYRPIDLTRKEEKNEEQNERKSIGLTAFEEKRMKEKIATGVRRTWGALSTPTSPGTVGLIHFFYRAPIDS